MQQVVKSPTILAHVLLGVSDCHVSFHLAALGRCFARSALRRLCIIYVYFSLAVLCVCAGADAIVFRHITARLGEKNSLM